MLGNISSMTLVMKAIFVAVGLRRQCVRAKERRQHRHVAGSAQCTGSAELLSFARQIEAITGLDLKCCDAFGQQSIQPWQGLSDKVGFARGARGFDGRHDTATSARHLFVGCACEAQFEFMRAVAAVDEMGMTVDQAWRDPTAAAVDDFCAARCFDRHLGLFARKDNAASASCYGTALNDAEAGEIRTHRRQPCVAVDFCGLCRTGHSAARLLWCS
jgi:hypothetical protein